MFFLKHVLPLVIISVLIGYVVARVGLPPADSPDAAAETATQIAGLPVRNDAETVAADQADILSRVREAVSERADPTVADNQDRYIQDVNSEIEAAVEEWTASSEAATAPAAENPRKPDQPTVTQADNTADTIADTRSTSITESTELAAAEPVTEPAAPGPETAVADEIAAAPAETDTVSIAMAEPASPVSDAALSENIADTATAELDEQLSEPPLVPVAQMSLEGILASRWTLGNEPAAPHLPSFITSCAQKGEGYECWSGEYVSGGENRARTKTKSIIRSADASGFTIRYRNMITDPATKRSKWDPEVKLLNCAPQGSNRIRCVDDNTGQEITYTRVTDEQFASRFTLSSLASTRWSSSGRPAEYLPSGATNCETEAAGLVCWSRTRTVQSAQGPTSVKTRSLIRKTGTGTFSVTYRNLVTANSGEGTWEQNSHEASCRVIGFEQIVCEEDTGSRSYAKSVLSL